MRRALIAGCGVAAVMGLAMVSAQGATTPVKAGPLAVSQPALKIVSTGLPSGQRQAIYDPLARTLWVLTRADADNGVLLTSVAEADGTARTTTLSADGTDWAAGSLAIHDGDVWASWGTHLVSFTPGTGLVRVVTVPWKDGADGMDGRSAAMAAAGECLWIGVIGEQQLRCYEPSASTWRTVSTPAGRPVSMFTKMASSGASALVNLGAPATSPTLPTGGTEIVWVPENTVPVSSESTSTTGVVGTDEAILEGPDVNVTARLSGGSGRPAVTLPTGMGGRTLARVSEAEGGNLVVERTDTATGAASLRTLAMPQISVRPGARRGFAPQDSASAQGWLAAKVAAVAVEPDGAVWVVSVYGVDAPLGWGTVVRFPAP